MRGGSFASILSTAFTEIGLSKAVDFYYEISSRLNRVMQRSLFLVISCQILATAVALVGSLAVVSGVMNFYLVPGQPLWLELFQVSGAATVILSLGLALTYRSAGKVNHQSGQEFTMRLARDIEATIKGIVKTHERHQEANQFDEMKAQIDRLEEALVLLSEAVAENQAKPADSVTPLKSPTARQG